MKHMDDCFEDLKKDLTLKRQRSLEEQMIEDLKKERLLKKDISFSFMGDTVRESLKILNAQDIAGLNPNTLTMASKMMRNPLFQDSIKALSSQNIGRMIKDMPQHQARMSVLGQSIAMWRRPEFSKDLLSLGEAAATLRTACVNFDSPDRVWLNQKFEHIAVLQQRVEPILHRFYPQFEEEKEDISTFFEENFSEKPQDPPINALAKTGDYLEKAFKLSQAHCETLAKTNPEEIDIGKELLTILWIDGTETPIEDLITGSVALAQANLTDASKIWVRLTEELRNFADKGNEPWVTGLNQWVELVRNMTITAMTMGAALKYLL